MAINDDKLAYYKQQLGVNDGSINDLEYKWLVSKGISPTSLPDMWRQYLVANGLPPYISDGKAKLQYPLNSGQNTNLLFNGDFSSTAVWQGQGPLSVISNGTASITRTDVNNKGSLLQQVGGLVVGGVYRAWGEILGANPAYCSFDSAGGNFNPPNISFNYTATVTQANFYLEAVNDGTTVMFDNMSLTRIG